MNIRKFFLVMAGLVSLGMAGAATATPCANSDVTFRGNNAEGCTGPNSGNDTAAVLGFGGGWSLLDKTDADSNTVFGVAWTVTSVGGSSGTWQLSWIAAAGSPGLPLTMDLGVAVKAGTSWSAWIFHGEEFTASGASGSPASGSYLVTWLNQGGQVPNLSHISVYGRNAGRCTSIPNCQPPDEVPEPGTLALFGLGLAGLGFGMRRRRKS